MHSVFYHTVFKPDVGGRRPTRAWLLEIISSANIGVCVCASAPEGINKKSQERQA